MTTFCISDIFASLSEQSFGRSSRTFSKWKAIIGLPRWARICNETQARLLVTCAIARAAMPTAPLTIADVIRYGVQNADRIEAVLGGVPRIAPAIEGAYLWRDAAQLISDASTCGIKPSDDTIARWCLKLGFNFSRATPIPAAVIYRLIEEADLQAEQRVARGKALAKQRKMRAAAA